MLGDHDVTTAADGLEAIRALREGSFDLILCDVLMPGADGPTVHRAMSELRPELQGRFVFLTGCGPGDAKRLGLRATGGPPSDHSPRIVT